MKVLAGDVGGTNTRLAVFETDRLTMTQIVLDVQPSRRFESFSAHVRAFLATHDVAVEAACFGLPGPIRGRCVALTNLPWEIDADGLERELALGRVTLINDLVANAHGLPTLDPTDFHVLRAGEEDPHGNAGLISAGTGLGQAGLHRVDGVLHPFATEGGHTDFAPVGELEWKLLRYLQDKHGDHVSWERVLCGPALADIYEFLTVCGEDDEPGSFAHELADAPDRSAVIGVAASDRRCRRAERAVELLLGFYGAEAGNLALKLMATGGVYLGGGIAPKLRELFPRSPFLERFDGKGRMRAWVEKIPVRIVLNDHAALRGAAAFASRSV